MCSEPLCSEHISVGLLAAYGSTLVWRIARTLYSTQLGVAVVVALSPNWWFLPSLVARVCVYVCPLVTAGQSVFAAPMCGAPLTHCACFPRLGYLSATQIVCVCVFCVVSVSLCRVSGPWLVALVSGLQSSWQHRITPSQCLTGRSCSMFLAAGRGFGPAPGWLVCNSDRLCCQVLAMLCQHGAAPAAVQMSHKGGWQHMVQGWQGLSLPSHGAELISSSLACHRAGAVDIATPRCCMACVASGCPPDSRVGWEHTLSLLPRWGTPFLLHV